MVAKTAATVEDERCARGIWSMHEAGVSPADIADKLSVPKKVVRDALNGRRLGPAISQRSAATIRRCPHCGKRVLSLPCLACEIEGHRSPELLQPAEPVVSTPDFMLSDTSVADWKPMGRPPKPRKLDDLSMARLRERLYCKQCGQRRMQTASGLVCPDGHGRIAMPVDPLDARSFDFTERLAALPCAKPAKGRSRIVVLSSDPDGQRYARVPSSKTDEHCLEVVVGSEIWFVRPHNIGNKACVPALD